MASAATGSHHLHGNLLAAAGVHDEEGDGVVLKQGLVLVRSFCPPSTSSCSWTGKLGKVEYRLKAVLD